MTSSNFRSYHQAVAIHQQCNTTRWPGYLRNQVLRASASIVLNLAEGSGKLSPAEQRRFYFIALGSLREVQAVLDLSPGVPGALREAVDRLGGAVYRLCHRKP